MSLEGDTQYIAMEVGDAHGCVVRADRQISCWDLNDPRNPGQAGASDPPTSSVAVLFDFPLP